MNDSPNSTSSVKNFNLSPMTEAIIHFTNALYDQETFNHLKKEEIRDVLSQGQLLSKIWLLEELKNILKTYSPTVHFRTAVVGGWVGILARSLNHLDERITADSIDIDPLVTKVAKLTLDKIRGSAITADMYKFNYVDYDCIVNTSAEHIENVTDWSNMIPKNKLVIVQSNNGRNIEGHISCVDSEEELKNLLNLSEIYYQGHLVFSNYTRYMVIGKK